jgi:hypothetical protein
MGPNVQCPMRRPTHPIAAKKRYENNSMQRGENKTDHCDIVHKLHWIEAGGASASAYQLNRSLKLVRQADQVVDRSSGPRRAICRHLFSHAACALPPGLRPHGRQGQDQRRLGGGLRHTPLIGAGPVRILANPFPFHTSEESALFSRTEMNCSRTDLRAQSTVPSRKMGIVDRPDQRWYRSRVDVGIDIARKDRKFSW